MPDRWKFGEIRGGAVRKECYACGEPIIVSVNNEGKAGRHFCVDHLKIAQDRGFGPQIPKPTDDKWRKRA